MVWQDINSIDLTFYKLVGVPISEDDITSLKENLNTQFIPGCVAIEKLTRNGDEWYYSITLRNPEEGKPLYENTDIECEPYSPAHLYLSNGDPGWPAEGGVIGGYDYIQDYLRKFFKCPDNWDYEVDDCDMDSIDKVWERYCYGEEY